MLDGKRISATRDTAKECEQWASQKIFEHKAQLKLTDDDKPTPTLAEVMALYHGKVGRHKPSASTESMYSRCLIRDYPEIANKQIHQITSKDLTAWRNSRLQSVSPGTVRREIAYLSSVMSYAIKELFLMADNPFARLAKPAMPRPRSRRISDDEIAIILASATYTQGTKPTQTQHYVAWAFLFAVHTAMRRGEILGITKDDIMDGYIHLPKTKNGDSRNVPLTPQARAMLTWLDIGDRLIPLTEDAFKKSWQRVQKKSRAGRSDSC